MSTSVDVRTFNELLHLAHMDQEANNPNKIEAAALYAQVYLPKLRKHFINLYLDPENNHSHVKLLDAFFAQDRTPGFVNWVPAGQFVGKEFPKHIYEELVRLDGFGRNELTLVFIIFKNDIMFYFLEKPTIVILSVESVVESKSGEAVLVIIEDDLEDGDDIEFVSDLPEEEFEVPIIIL